MRITTYIITEHVYRGVGMTLTRSDSDLNLDLDTNATNLTILSGCNTNYYIVSVQQSGYTCHLSKNALHLHVEARYELNLDLSCIVRKR